MTSPSVVATQVVSSNVFLLWASALFTPNPSAIEWIWGCACSMMGAFTWQFIVTQKQREDGKAKGVKQADLPRVDLYTLACAMAGAPLISSLLIWAVHASGGTTSSLLSTGLFMAAGAGGPTLVMPLISLIVRYLTNIVTAVLTAMTGGGPKP